jgi:hypothetical protein
MIINNGRNLILGAATGYSPSALRVFLASLAASGFHGKVALLVYPDQLDTIVDLRAHGVTPVMVERSWRGFPKSITNRLSNRGRMRQLHLWIDVAAGLLSQWKGLRFGILWALAAPLHHIANRRYYEYWKFLTSVHGEFDRVLLADTRDVVFQADPFQWPIRTPLAVFGEGAHTPVNGEPCNKGWIEYLYGESGLDSIRHKQILCSGTTMGTLTGIIDYLEIMIDEAFSRTDKIIGPGGVDQGMHIWLFWNGRLPAATLFQTGEGPVATLHLENPESFQFDRSGNLLNRDGSIVPIVHQYDRHPQLRAHYEERFQTDGSGMDGVQSNAATE